jgi:hypothetical protein
VKTERNSQIKRDRRAVMSHLNMCWPGTMPLEELFLVMIESNPQYERKYLARDVIYLQAKGYVEITRIDGNTLTNVSVEKCKVVLTAAGTDVANQFIDDPTLDV